MNSWLFRVGWGFPRSKATDGAVSLNSRAAFDYRTAGERRDIAISLEGHFGAFIPAGKIKRRRRWPLAPLYLKLYYLVV